MITDSELLAAVAGILRETNRGDISVNIAARDIRAAVAKFNAQESETVSEQPA